MDCEHKDGWNIFDCDTALELNEDNDCTLSLECNSIGCSKQIDIKARIIFEEERITWRIKNE